MSLCKGHVALGMSITLSVLALQMSDNYLRKADPKANVSP